MDIGSTIWLLTLCFNLAFLVKQFILQFYELLLHLAQK